MFCYCSPSAEKERSIKSDYSPKGCLEGPEPEQSTGEATAPLHSGDGSETFLAPKITGTLWSPGRSHSSRSVPLSLGLGQRSLRHPAFPNPSFYVNDLWCVDPFSPSVSRAVRLFFPQPWQTLFLYPTPTQPCALGVTGSAPGKDTLL